MSDHIPTHKAHRNEAMERAAAIKDITDRAKLARPVGTGRDILLSHDAGYMRLHSTDD